MNLSCEHPPRNTPKFSASTPTRKRPEINVSGLFDELLGHSQACMLMQHANFHLRAALRLLTLASERAVRSGQVLRKR